MATYLALLHKEDDSDFGVSFPDFPGCVTAGTSLDEARRFAAEALQFHIEGMVADGLEVPAPTPLDQAAKLEEARDAVHFLVDVPDPPTKTVRLNITFPEAALEEVDRFARRAGLSRSAFLFIAANAHLKPDREGWEAGPDDTWWKDGVPFIVVMTMPVTQTPLGAEPQPFFVIHPADEDHEPTGEWVRWADTKHDAQQLAEEMAQG